MAPLPRIARQRRHAPLHARRPPGPRPLLPHLRSSRLSLAAACDGTHAVCDETVPIVRRFGAIRPVPVTAHLSSPPMRLFAATVLVALMLSDLAGAAWHSPVPGSVTRPFDLGSDPFEAGRHRGVDFSASPGTTVRAACAGPVAFAGTAGSSGRVVTVLCGPWRVTHMPLASIAVRQQATVREGAPLGTLAGSHEHAGLHLGVRRDGTRFGYADPLRFLAAGRPTAPPLGPAPRPTRTPRPAPPRPPAPRPPAPHPAPAPPRPVAAPSRTLVPPRLVAAPPAAAGSNRRPGPPFAPWPAWFGPGPRAHRSRHPRARALAEGSRAGGGGRSVAREGREARGGWLASDARWPSTSPRRSTT